MIKKFSAYNLLHSIRSQALAESLSDIVYIYIYIYIYVSINFL